MAKMIKIERCGGCPYKSSAWWFPASCMIDPDYSALLPRNIDVTTIPSWCPLSDAPEEEEDDG